MEIKPGKYRHFKGNEYQVLYVAKHSETQEPMVVYQALYGEGGIWVRPAAMWTEPVERDGYSGPRFRYIGDSEGIGTIREMTAADQDCVLDMMRTFYASPAVLSNGSEEIFRSDIEHCISSCPYLEGYIFQEGSEIQGYAMAARSFSTEFGKPCIWIEDLYIKPQFRGQGIGSRFFAFIEEKYPGVVLRLEAEPENERAIHVYQKCGYEVLPYLELKKEN